MDVQCPDCGHMFTARKRGEAAKALTKSPRYGGAYIGRGKASRMIGKTREAGRAYERHLELHPVGPSASIARNAIRSLKP